MNRLPLCRMSVIPGDPVLHFCYVGPRSHGIRLAKDLRDLGFSATFQSKKFPHGLFRFLFTDAPLSVLQVRALAYFADFECRDGQRSDGLWRHTDADGRVRYVDLWGKAC